MKIDVFNHVVLPKYIEAANRLTKNGHVLREGADTSPAEFDCESRFRIMDKYPDYVQVLTCGRFHNFAYSDKAPELAKIVNEELAETVSRYPDRFVAGVACLPMNDMKAALAEVDRAVKELGLRGIELWVSKDGKSIDTPKFMPLYEKMAQYNLPIWLHPYGGATSGHYRGEKEPKYNINAMFGWPYDTTVAMARLVFSGVLEKYPNLKFITHHCGAMVPYLAGRIRSSGSATRAGGKGLTRPPIDYFRMFYNDTALHGWTASLMCGYSFFGAEHLLLGTDMPLGGRPGEGSVEATIRAIEQMAIPDSDKKKIFEGNTRKLLRLGV